MSELVVTAAAVAILPSRGIAFILELWCWRPVCSTREPENIWNCRQKAKVPVRKFLTFESLQTTNTRSRQLRGFRKLVFDGFRYHQSSSGKHSENPKIVLVKKLKVHSKTLRAYLKKLLFEFLRSTENFYTWVPATQMFVLPVNFVTGLTPAALSVINTINTIIIFFMARSNFYLLYG